MARLQKYGIQFPIIVNADEQTLFGLNNTRAEKVKSELLHLIFTPKGQRLRQPEFGTRLIQFLFNNVDDVFSDVVSEIKETVKLWIPDCDIQEIEVNEVEEGLGLMVRIRYTLREVDGSEGNYEIISKI